MRILVTCDHRPEWLERLSRETRGAADLVVAECEAAARAAMPEADAVLGNRFFLQSLAGARRLRWMQSNSMGVDRLVPALRAHGSVVLTNTRGLYDDEVADHALALILGLVRNTHGMRDDAARRVWRRHALRQMSDLDALILGWGGVGRGIARRLVAFGTRVRAARRGGGRRVQPDRKGGAGSMEVLTGDAWRERLPRTDLVVLALPLTPSTRQLFGAAELDRMRPGGWVVNVGRGETLDAAALLRALADGWLAGAALDVFESEPLPPEHPAWSEPRLVISPHAARSLEQPPFRWEELFAENARRFLAGRPLLNVVDLEAGY